MGEIGSEGGVGVDGSREEPGREAGWHFLFWPREPEELDLDLQAVGVSMVLATGVGSESAGGAERVSVCAGRGLASLSCIWHLMHR